MNSRLDLSPEQMREYGYRVVDRIVEHLSTLPGQRVGSKADPAEILERFNQPPPEGAGDFPALLDQLEREVLQKTMHVNHPRFFAYVPGPGNFIGALADALASGYNIFAGTWISGSGPTAIELQTIGWLRDFCGFPPSTGGLFVSGGTMANLTALAVARHARLGEDMREAVVYCSDQMHSSNEKAIRVLGFAARQLRKLTSDSQFRLPVDRLRREIESDRARGRRPFCVIATAGTTNTGAVDDMPAIADLCAEQGLWLHVDGAFGAAAVISETGRAQLSGLERADSLSLDPHKWLFQPFEAGCVLVRDRSHLRSAFQILPEYLGDTHLSADEINPTDLGIQLTRSFRALKLWLSVQTFGMASFRAAIERGFALSHLVESQPAPDARLGDRHRSTDGGGLFSLPARRCGIPSAAGAGDFAGRVCADHIHRAARANPAAHLHQQPAHHRRGCAGDLAPHGPPGPGAGCGGYPFCTRRSVNISGFSVSLRSFLQSSLTCTTLPLIWLDCSEAKNRAS